jgi:hypothetical protein
MSSDLFGYREWLPCFFRYIASSGASPMVNSERVPQMQMTPNRKAFRAIP